MCDEDNEMSPYFISQSSEQATSSTSSSESVRVEKSLSSCVLPQLLSILPSKSLGEKDNYRCKEDTEEEVDPWEDEEEDDDLNFVTDAYGKDYLVSQDDRGRLMYVDLTTGDVKTSLFLPSALKRKRKRWMKNMPEGVLNKFFLDRGNGSSKKVLVRNPESSSVDRTMSLGQDVVQSIKSSRDQSLNPSSVKWGGEGPQVKSMSPMKNTSKAFYEGLKLSARASSSAVRFEKDDLAKMQVLFQVDKKFILGKSLRNGRELVVLFDQHAVHERIRLERLLKEAYDDVETRKFKSFPIAPPIQLSFTETEVMMLQSYPETFKLMGTNLQIISPTCVKVHSAPLCFFEKVSSEVIANKERTMKDLLASLLQDEARHILDTKVTSANSVPKAIFNILASKACRGAVKFGHILTTQQCELLITRLKDCKTPFQCAHGRPSLVPLVDLNTIRERTDHCPRKCQPPHFDLALSQNSCIRYNETSPYFKTDSSGYFEDDGYDDIFTLL